MRLGSGGGRNAGSVGWRRRRWYVVKAMKFTAVYVKVPEGYAAFAGELPGSNTQGETIEEARENLKEAIELVLAANRVLAEESIRGREVR